MGNRFTYRAEYDWWVDQLKRNICIHPTIAYFITQALLKCRGYNCADKVLSTLPAYYEDAINWWKENFDTGNNGKYYNYNSLTYIDYLI